MKPAPAVFLFCLILGLQVRLGAQAPAPLQADFGEASLREWVQPDYPAAAREARLEGRVDVEFVVETDGHVTRASVRKSTDERFNASALAAVQRWVFSPALADAKPVASGMRVPVMYKLDQLHQERVPLLPSEDLLPVQLPVTPPQLTVSPDPDYPAELEERKLAGQVILEFVVDTDGTTHAPKVLWASHAAFVSEALKTLEKYRFEPSRQGPLPMKSGPTRGQMEFVSLGQDRAGALAANHLSVVDPDKSQDPPRPTVMAEPVYPNDRLLAGEAGSAAVVFTVTELGKTADVVLKEASQPEFGAALVAAAESWKFDAALNGQQEIAVKLIAAWQFVPPGAGVAGQLLAALKPAGTGVKGAGGLDQRLRPIWRIQPVYPDALRTDKPTGKTEIEFIIDRDGRIRFPRVISASRPEFGWAAATAINQWVFARPLRGGQPTDVKVSIPVEFTPPKD